MTLRMIWHTKNVIADIAAAALLKIRWRIEFTPAMSTTEYIMVMSVSSMYGLMSPEATVDTISLGNPIGHVFRIRAQASEEPELPAAETIPWILNFRDEVLNDWCA